MSSATFPLAGHDVHRIGFGAMQLPGPGVMGPPRDRDEALAVLRRALELGVDHIDTAQFYGPDVANELIREALRPYPDSLVLVSKVGGRRDDDGNWLPAQTPEELRRDVHTNLRELGVESLPVVNLRVMTEQESGPGHEYAPFEDQLAVMQQLVADGSLQAFGVSNVSHDQVATALDAGAACVQNAYNLLHRDDEPTLQLCEQRGVPYVPFFPLGSAFDALPKVTDDDAVQAVAQRHGVAPTQVGLAWLLAHAPNILLIPGTSSRAHLEENMATADVTLTDDDLAELERR